MNNFLTVLLLFFVLATLLVLVAGVAIMGRGGKLDEKWSNRLMVARVSLQGIAVLILCLLFLVS